MALVRNVTLHRISGDLLQNSVLMLNVTASECGGSALGHHTDLFQFTSASYPHPSPNATNVIAYGVVAPDLAATQAFFWRFSAGAEFRDAAFVNILANVTWASPPHSQNYNRNSHILFKHVTLLGQFFMLRATGTLVGQEYVAENVVFDGCVFTSLSLPTLPGVTARNSHMLTPLNPVPGFTLGGTVDDLFVNPTLRDFRPRVDSLLVSRVPGMNPPADIAGVRRPKLAATGALEP
jgi:hypothetical protein